MAYELKVFSENLRAALKEANLSQGQFASRVGVTLSSVSNWCRGLNEPKSFQILAIARELDRPVEWFFEDHDTDTVEVAA